MDLEKLFEKPKVACIVGDINTGKSNLIYDLVTELREYSRFKLITYGLRNHLPYAKEIYSIEELENVKNSIIIIDELFSLWDLDNRKVKRQIENSLRLIHHNNNILILCAVPENLKKFLSAKITLYFFKKCTISDLINGSSVKNIVCSYRGAEMGNTILNLPINESLIWETDKGFMKLKGIKYYRDFDTKKDNAKLFSQRREKSVTESVPKSVPENALKTCNEKNVTESVPVVPTAEPLLNI